MAYFFLVFSCFLLTMESDSIEGIYDTLKQCALISKSAGGIGLNVHKIRATGSYIAGVSAGSVQSHGAVVTDACMIDCFRCCVRVLCLIRAHCCV